MIKLKSIAEEAADCRKAFENFKDGNLALHCHHHVLIEIAGNPEERISYILKDKPESEQALRLRLFRPLPTGTELEKAHAEWDVAYAEWSKARAEWEKASIWTKTDKAGAEWRKALTELDKACAEWDKALTKWNKACTIIHEKYCDPDCPWDGRTIFHALECAKE